MCEVYGAHHGMEQMQLEDNKVRKESVTMLAAIITQKIEFFFALLQIHILLCVLGQAL